MRRKNSWCLALVIFYLLIASASAIKISEVELNPEGTDPGNEWAELYSQNAINLSDYIIKNRDNSTINLTGEFSGYFIINFTGQWLDNSNEIIYLIFNNSIIDETPKISDSGNDNRSWQFCGNWSFVNSTKGYANRCIENQTQETPENKTQNNAQDNSGEVYIKIDYDNETENGKEIYIDVRLFNLKDYDYDLKVYITFEENDTIISDTYNNDSWRNSNYFLDNVISGPGNKTAIVKLKINSKYKYFSGIARIKAKLRKYSSQAGIAIFDERIVILEKAQESVVNPKAETSDVDNTENKQDIVYLSWEKEYISKNEKIKIVGIYGFVIFCIILIGLYLWKKL